MCEQVIFNYEEIRGLRCSLENFLKSVNELDDVILPVSDQDPLLKFMDTLIIGLRNEAERLLVVINSKLDKT